MLAIAQELNCWLNCALLGAKCTKDTERFSIDGHISKEKLIELVPGYAEPLRTGLNWLVFRWQLEAAVPRLAKFLQSAGNKSHGVERKPTRMQRLFQLHSMAAVFRVSHWQH